MLTHARSEQKGLRYLILISGANYLYTNMILATYHIRELTLLVNENYTNLYDTNRTRYIANHIGTLARIYQAMILGHSLITPKYICFSFAKFNFKNI